MLRRNIIFQFLFIEPPIKNLNATFLASDDFIKKTFSTFSWTHVCCILSHASESCFIHDSDDWGKDFLGVINDLISRQRETISSLITEFVSESNVSSLLCFNPIDRWPWCNIFEKMFYQKSCKEIFIELTDNVGDWSKAISGVRDSCNSFTSLLSNFIDSLIVWHEVLCPSVRRHDHLTVSMECKVSNKLWNCFNVVRKLLCFGLREWGTASISVAARVCRWSALIEMIVPVSIWISSEAEQVRWLSCLSPWSIVGPSVRVAIWVCDGDYDPLKGCSELLNLRVGWCQKFVQHPGCCGGWDPLASMHCSLEDNTLLFSASNVDLDAKNVTIFIRFSDVYESHWLRILCNKWLQPFIDLGIVPVSCPIDCFALLLRLFTINDPEKEINQWHLSSLLHIVTHSWRLLIMTFVFNSNLFTSSLNSPNLCGGTTSSAFFPVSPGNDQKRY